MLVFHMCTADNADESSNSWRVIMRYALMVLIMITVVVSGRPISSIPRLAETWEENQYVFPLVEDVPASLLPDGVTDLVIAGLPTGELAMTVYLLGDGPDGTEVLASGPYQGEYNFAKSFAYWIPDNSLLEITFQMPFCARYAGASYQWVGSELVPVEWLSGDPSMDALEAVDSLLAIGKIEEAATELGYMFYPGAYYYPGEMTMKFLRSAHENGLEEYSSGDPEGAVQLFRAAEEAMDFLLIRYPWYRAFEDSSDFMESNLAEFATIGEFTMIANDYGFFLEQAGMYDEAVDVLYGVLTLDPGRMVAYLNLGDALWGLGEYHSAVEQYILYKEMMESLQLDDDIPGRVDQRVLNYLGPM
jgi:tetratricopeptide (TPR) repeat protein